MSQHWDEQALTDYSLGELDKAQAEQLELHLASCSQCLAEFNAIQDAIALLQADQWDVAPAALTQQAIGLFQAPAKPAGLIPLLAGWFNWPRFRQQPWAAPALVGALASVALLVFFGWLLLREPAGAPGLIQVEVLQGIVELSEAGGSWQPVSGTIELKDNQRIRTRDGAEALISLQDLADITLYSDSELGLLD
ncbi:MAG: zf-HC2 domain-containing protein, partial [Anaerolineales bacterium]|nr:zf-HC2 domain-containing protein [Anaerolineales bacterium]